MSARSLSDFRLRNVLIKMTVFPDCSLLNYLILPSPVHEILVISARNNLLKNIFFCTKSAAFLFNTWRVE